MTFRPAYDVPLSYKGQTVWLRPSLWAATRLESLHGGFPRLLAKVEEFDTATINAVISHSVTNRVAGMVFLKAIRNQPLSLVRDALTTPILELIAALMLPKDEDETETTSPSKPTAWADLYRKLFGLATGWLGWSPSDAWDATPQDILTAYEAHVDSLRAIHGTASDDPEVSQGQTDEQRQANAAAGLDPEFNRAGLQELRALESF